MLRAFLGKKIGMTQIYEEGGNVVPVTVIQAGPCFVTQIRTPETDGYEAVQIGFDEVKKLNKPRAGHVKNSKMVRFLREVKADNSTELAPGAIGGGTTPGRVYKGQKMSGHMGNVRITVKNLEVVQVDLERNLLIVKGAVPGGPNSLLTVRKTRKVAAGS